MSILRPRFVARRIAWGVLDMLGLGTGSVGDVGDKVGATVVAGVAEAASMEALLDIVAIVSKEALLRTWMTGRPPNSLVLSW